MAAAERNLAPIRGDAFYRLDDDLIAGTLTSPPGISTLRQVLPSVGCYDFAIELTNRVFLASSNGLNCLDFTSNGTPEVLGTLLTNQISGLDGHDHTLTAPTSLSIPADPRETPAARTRAADRDTLRRGSLAQRQSKGLRQNGAPDRKRLVRRRLFAGTP